VNAPPVYCAGILFACEISMEAWLWSRTDTNLCNMQNFSNHMTVLLPCFLSGIGYISIYLYDSAKCDAEVEHNLFSLKK